MPGEKPSSQVAISWDTGMVTHLGSVVQSLIKLILNL